MDSSFSLTSPVGSFDLTADQETMMVYVEKRRNASVPEVRPSEIPSWCFDPDAIWFYFGAPEPEDKVSAGEKLKEKLLECVHVLR